MALFTRGNLCSLCKLPMQSRKEVVVFPHLVSNAHDPLFAFNGVVVHKTCVQAHPWGAAALRQKQYVHNTILPAKKRQCVLCGENENNAAQLIATGLLTVDEKHPLYRYNWLEAHKRCVSHWEELPVLVHELEKYSQSGQWADFHNEYRAMETLINSLSYITPGRACTARL